jgi:hypothetical protein
MSCPSSPPAAGGAAPAPALARGEMSGGSVSAVFYADKYHPIQVGSIDGTDVAPHDNAVLRALICSQAGLCACASPLPPSVSLLVSYLDFPPVPFQTTLSATPRPPETPTARSSSAASRARPTTTRFGRCAPSGPLTCCQWNGFASCGCVLG